MATRALTFLLMLPVLTLAEKQEKPKELSPIDRLIQESRTEAVPGSPGSAFETTGRMGELFRDLRASQIGDIVTIIVRESASAVSRGTTTSGRDSSANVGVTSLAGPLRAAGPLTNLTSSKGKWELQGKGETSRETSLSTRLSTRVIHALPNGNLIVEGTREIVVNSERQRVSVRGVVRWNDLSQFNTVSSDRISDLEVKIEGRGVVQDAIRRPNILYRILLGILPF